MTILVDLEKAVNELQLAVCSAATCATTDKDWHILQQEVLRLKEAIRELNIAEGEAFDFYDSQAERGEYGHSEPL